MKQPKEPVKVPEPRQSKRRPSATSRVFMWTFLLLIAVTIAAGAASYYAYQQYTDRGPLAERKVFIVEQGASTRDIGAALESEGIISNARLFSVMAYVTGTRTRLKAGEYAFEPQASMQDVVALIASGKSITYKLSVPEGFTSEMAVARVNANEILTGEPAAVPAEGAIMPDTYVFRRGMTRQKLVEDMQSAQRKLIDELWETRVAVPAIETKEQAIILASIVEKETGVAAERPVIASVFINRLKKGMRLQSDPTIIYGIAGGKGKLDRALTRTDIETETPYNTYRIKGLPPGPIANPGRAALEAVLNPPTTDYLYFVADGTGGHAFAATLEEHNRNVKKWREISGNAAAVAASESPEAEAPAPPASANGSTSEQVEPAQPAPVAPPEATAPPATLEAAPEPQAPPPEPPPPAAPPPAPAATEPASPAVPSAAPPAGTAAPAAEAAPPPPAKPAAAVKPSAPKPGTVLKVGGKLVVIPKPKPRR